MLLRRTCAVPAFRSCSSCWFRAGTVRSPQHCQARYRAARATSSAVETSAMPSVWDAVLRRYDEAQAQKASSSIETNTQLLGDDSCGVTFILKIAAALRDKPKPPAPSSGEKREWRNPFLPYEEALWVEHLSPTHTLLLNKFNVVPHHLLIVTREFESQLDPLNAADMEATWAVMQCMPNGGLAFYNRGPASGASQPHKHIQLVPLPLEGASASSSGSSSSSSGVADPGPPIWPAIQPALQAVQAWQEADLSTCLPFAAFAVPLPAPEAVTQELLAEAFARLLARCRSLVAATRQQQVQRSGGGAAAGSGAGAAGIAAAAAGSRDGDEGEGFSYNMLLTRRFLLLVPRSRESDGPVSCNSVAFAGSFFVRSREEIEHVGGRGPMAILAAVGFPWH